MGSDVTGNVNVIGAEGKQGTVSKIEDVMGLLLVDQFIFGIRISTYKFIRVVLIL